MLGRYPLSSHSSESLSVRLEDESPSVSISVTLSVSPSSLSLLVSSVSMTDTGSDFTLALRAVLEEVITVLDTGLLFLLFITPLVLIFPFAEDFLGVVFFENVTVFFGGVFLTVVYTRLESACSLSGRNIKEEAICYSAGPVCLMLLTLPDDPQYTWTMMKVETRRNFSNKKMVVHAAALFAEFRKQRLGENLRKYIVDYVRLMKEATEKTPKDEYDVTAKTWQDLSHQI